jgi:Tol biopolymer transport system component
MKRMLAGPITAVAAFGVLAGPVHATFPGERGPIAFERITKPKKSENPQIFTVGFRGGQAQRLTFSPGGAFSPDYSPDGRRILFERRFGGKSQDALFSMGSDGSDRVRLTTTCSGECLGESAPAWAPDGLRIVFERAFGPIIDDTAQGLDIVIANSDGTGDQTIRRFRSLEGEGREPHDVQWSPDGQSLAVNILNIVAKPRNGSAIYTLKPDGSDLRQITPLRLNAGNPDWSPDGKRIVFNSSYEGQGRVEIYTVRPDGSGLRRVRREPRMSYSFDPVWSPDGRRIAFVHGAGRRFPHIWTMKRNGTGLRKVTRGPHPDFRPDWGSRPG